MPDIHLTRELLQAVARGELPARVVTEIGVQHLMSLCSTCRREILAFERGRRSQGAAETADALQFLPGFLDEQVPRLQAEQRQAAQDFEELMALPPEERTSRVHRARRRFRSAPLVRHLIAESQQRVIASPEEAFHLAELGRIVAHHNPQMPGVFALIALATAQMANACRVSGGLREAEEHFGHVRYVVTQHKVTDPEVLARIDELEGSLRKDQSRFGEAETLLKRAATLYRTSGSKTDAARVLLNLGSLYFFRGEVDRALEVVQAVLKRLPLRADRRLHLCARHNLSFYLTEAGDFVQAAEQVARNKSLYDEFPDVWTQLRLAWLQARIAAGFGESDRAEQLFLSVRDGFIAQGNGYDAAMVSLELAMIYVREGRTSDTKRLAEEIYPILQAQDVHREAAAALMLFQEAARHEELTVTLVRKFAVYLRDARLDSSLRFEQIQPS